jgi:hypothetical protein
MRVCRIAYAQSNLFINPPPWTEDGNLEYNQVYAIGSSISFQWRTNYTSFSLVIGQVNRYPASIVLSNVSNVKSYFWKVEIAGVFDLEDTNCEYDMINAMRRASNRLNEYVIFFAEVASDPNNIEAGWLASHDFNITNSTSEWSQSSLTPTTLRPTAIPSSTIALSQPQRIILDTKG